MSAISTILANLRHTVNVLRSAVYAIDVRDDIADAIDDSADAIEQIYSDVDSASLREDAFAAALQEAIDDNLLPIPATVIDDNSLPGSKIQQGSLPLDRLAEPVQITVDSALSDSSTNPVQNKVVKGALDELNGSLNELQNTVDVINDSIGDLGGLTDAQKSALLACFRNVAWKETDGVNYYNLLEASLYDINIVSISATFKGGTTIIFTDTPLSTVKQYLLVTALVENGARIVVTDYTLSGSLIDGTSVLTVTYREKTTTVNVPAYAETKWISGYDANNATRVAYHVSPFICGTDQYQYDYSRRISAIETNFVVAGKLTIGKYTAPLSDGKAFDIQTNWSAITTINVPTTGLQKIKIDPITLLDGESLTFGENSLIGGDDSAFWNYGENGVDKGFYSSNYNSNKFIKNSRSLGMNVYTIRG